METFALFDDKTSSKIEFEFLGVTQRDKERIQINCFTDNNDVEDSAEKGIWATYNSLENANLIQKKGTTHWGWYKRNKATQKLIPKGKKYYIACEFDESKLKRQVTGESAGLAFAVKFAQEIYRQSAGSELGYSVAATGELSGRTKGARVKKVSSINEKLLAAYECLKAGDKALYPIDNKSEIDPLLAEKLIQKKIQLCPVGTVKEAIECLFDWKFQNKRNIRKWIPKIMAIAALAFIIYYIPRISPKPCYEQVTNRLQYGDLISAKEDVNRCLKKHKNADPRLSEIAKQLNTDLYLTINFEYIKKDSHSVSQKSLSDLTLSVGDGYRFSISPSVDCYFYLFQFDSNEGVELLFPLTAFSIENHKLRKNQVRLIPGGDNYFYLTKNTQQGTITFYFVATCWRAMDIEKVFQKYNHATRMSKLKYREELIKRMNSRRTLLKEGVKGLFYHKEYFIQE
ncbi:MAG: DUF4384 domain-containing protein [Actinobacteria bacterium]|nr:DUF4384 domain-containing protein [Actinomycetota bacterium]